MTALSTIVGRLNAGSAAGSARGIPSGMSLVEVLVALTILSIALVVGLDALQATNRANHKSDYLTVATRAAGDRIAQIQAAGYAALVNGTTRSKVNGLPSDNTMTVTIGPLSGKASLLHLKQIDITVTWNGSTQTTSLGGQLKMTTLLSESH